MYQRWGKRFFDFILAGMGLILLFPLFILVVVALYISGERNPFFIQLRPGIHGLPFTIIKFKTMRTSYSPHINAQIENERITKLGKVLRKTSLDELPQLWNVLLGHMSLIGPRPLLMEYLPLYSAVQHERHRVKPGITGWAQVHGRNMCDWKERLAMDVWYAHHISLETDLKILIKTIYLFLHPNAHASQETDIPEKFKG